MKTKLNENNIKTVLLDKTKIEDWNAMEGIGKKLFPNQFSRLIEKVEKSGGWENLLNEDYNYVSDVIFAEVNGEKVGCALVNFNHIIFEDVESRKNTLYLQYLMVLPKYQGYGLGTKLLNSVLEYAKENNFNYVELINTINVKKFSTKKNIYCKNNLKNVKAYNPYAIPMKGSLNKRKQIYRNIYFRIDVDSDIRDYSKAMFESFKKFYNEDLSALDELVLKNEISKKYCDIIKTKKKLSRDEINEIKNNEIFNDLSVSLTEMIAGKFRYDPTRVAIDSLKVKKMLKTLDVYKKANLENNESLECVQHFNKIERILCGVSDEILNEKNLAIIKYER